MVFVFPGPRPSSWLPALALAPNFYLTALVSQEPKPAYTNLVLPIYIYWPWPTILLPCSEFVFTFLSIVVAVAVVILAIVVIS